VIAEPLSDPAINGIETVVVLVTVTVPIEGAAGTELITMEKDDVVAVVVFVSVMRAVIAKVPVAVGVPEITPVAPSSVTPAGSDPEAMEKVPVPDPPLLVSVSE
jgi:hypothetical protein